MSTMIMPAVSVLATEEKTINDCDIHSLKHRFERQALSNPDYSVIVGRDRLDLDNGKLIVNDSKEYDFTDTGYRGLQAKLGLVPKQYLQDLKPATVQKMFNDKIEANYGKELFLRTSNDTTLRAVLSDRYSKTDNHEVLTQMIYALQNNNQDFIIKQMHISDDYMYLKCLNPSHVVGGHNFGFIISNSETGCGSINMQAFIYRLICSNGAIRQLSGDKGVKRKHIGNFDITGALRFAATNSVNDCMVMLDKIEQLKAISVKYPIQTLEHLVKQAALPEHIAKKAAEMYEFENDNTMHGVIQTLTRTAQHVNLDNRIKLEKLGGELPFKINKTNVSRFDFLD